MDRGRRILASLINSSELWEAAVKLPVSIFQPGDSFLFKILKEHYAKYGCVMPQEAINDRVVRMNVDKEVKRDILKLYYTFKGKEIESSIWDIDALKEERAQEKLLESLGNAVRALKDGVEIDGRYYTGYQGAISLLEVGQEAIGAVPVETAFDMYQRRKAKKDILPVDLFEPLVKELFFGEFWIICGYAGDGKTTVSMNLAHELSEKERDVLYVTLETPAHVARWKLVSMASRRTQNVIDYHAIRSGLLTPEQEIQFVKLLEESEKHITVIEAPIGIRMGELHALIRTQFRRKFYGLVVIDWLGLLVTRAQDHGAHLNEYVKRLKEMAKTMRTCVLALHQANRQGWVEAVKKGFYTLTALSDINEAEKTTDGVGWVLKLSHLKSRLGIMKYRDEPLDMGRHIELGLDPQTHLYLKSTTPTADTGIEQSWEGQDFMKGL